MATLQTLLDRSAIQDVLVRYCRGVDRRDVALLKDVYWPDATDDHGFFKGNGHDFAEWNVASTTRSMTTTQHFLTNFWCEIDGDGAIAESYVLAYHKMVDDDAVVSRVFGPAHLARHGEASAGGHDLVLGGQYFDRLERRDGVWRISHRVSTTHWGLAQPGSVAMQEGLFRPTAAMRPAFEAPLDLPA